jgi:serine/threonine protein kinase
METMRQPGGTTREITFSLPLIVDQRVPYLAEPFLADQLGRVLAQSRQQAVHFAPAHGEGDFEVLRWLGAGPNGVVYRARQLSLNRMVALKVFSQERPGTVAAALPEHENIVRIYAEVYDPARRLRFLYMPYVAGLSLARIAAEVRASGLRVRTGADLLAVIEAAIDTPLVFNASLARDRARFQRLRLDEAIAEVGIRLAQALDFAHRHGVFHRNVKAENILLNAYGRPFLTDFSPRRGQPHSYAEKAGIFWAAEPPPVGSTLPPDAYPRDAQGEEIATLARALGGFYREIRGQGESERARARTTLPPVDLAEILGGAATAGGGKGLSPSAFRAELEAFGEQRDVEAKLPRMGPLMRLSARFPLLSLVLVRQGPHLMGTFTCTMYCLLRPGLPLTPAQREVMIHLLRRYTQISYPVGIALVIAIALQTTRAFRRRATATEPGDEPLAGWRRRSLLLPLYIAGVNSTTWLPSIGVFTAVSYWLTGRFHPSGFAHFSIAVFLAYLIATAYSSLYVLFFSVQVLYPRLIDRRCGIRALASEEMGPILPWLRWLPLVLASIPLTAGILLVQSGPADLSAQRLRLMQLFLMSLIIVGAAGFLFSLGAIQRLRRVVRALTVV